MNSKTALVGIFVVLGSFSVSCSEDFDERLNHPTHAIRIATFNVSMSRGRQGELIDELSDANNSSVKEIAGIIQRVRPDILLLNEFDFDSAGNAARLFATNYLNIDQAGSAKMEFPYRFTAAVNTGEPSPFDLNKDGKKGGPADAYGFGEFPGQYGMLVFSRFPIQKELVRTFKEFRWKDMPEASKPELSSSQPFYSDEEWAALRLSSKSHWDLPIKTMTGTIHLLAFHPTPPVFDGREDRNGCRNHDEIRFWADYISPEGNYIYDDKNRLGGWMQEDAFVIAGDANADPFDGDSKRRAIKQLLDHPRINSSANPSSPGGAEQAKKQGGKNETHRGNPAFDTADFGDQGRASGNLRIDYVLPSKDLTVVNSGVFWPPSSHPDFKLIDASDHRLVWIDVSHQ